MRVLYLVSNRNHLHDYLVDYLFVGLCNVLGHQNVFDWPENPSLHGDASTCVVCESGPYGSEQNVPSKGHSLQDAIEACDLAVIATQPGDYPMAEALGAFRRAWPADKPVVAVDSGDSNAESGSFYRSVAGRPLTAYFKRELPIGATWALPFPISFPRSMMPAVWPDRKGGIFYQASNHGARLDGPGRPRMEIVEDLRCRGIPVGDWVRLWSNDERRTDPAEYRRQMAHALVGISWNGAPIIQNWDCMRFWENFAHGLAQVSCRPTIQIPHAPVDGEHCVYVDTPDQVGPAVESLLRDPVRAVGMARAGMDHFVRWHCSEVRASYLLNVSQLLGGK